MSLFDQLVGEALRSRAATVRETVEQESYWNSLTGVVADLGRKALA